MSILLQQDASRIAAPVGLGELPPLTTVGFPGRELVSSALALYAPARTTAVIAGRRVSLDGPYGPTCEGEAMPEGRAFRLAVGPGVVAVRSMDPARRERRKDNPALPLGGVSVDDRATWHAGLGRYESAAAQAARWAATGPHPFDGIAGYGQWLAGEARHAGTPAGWATFSPEYLDALKAERPSWRCVTEWSRKSRANFQRAIAELDWTDFFAQPGVPGMLTLTYPGDWLTVAPTGKAVKRHMDVFRKRFARRFGRPLIALWKLEFQARGAPHVHMFVMVPGDRRVFRDWCRSTWAAIVNHPDPEERARHARAGASVDFNAGGDCRDPRRLAVYFAKHGSKTKDSKEYQHTVPEAWRTERVDKSTGEILPGTPGVGPGRFWGYWGLVRASLEVDVTQADYYTLRRTVRRWAKARNKYLGKRPPRSLGARGGASGGWVMVNDGPAFAATLARHPMLAARRV